MKLFLTCVPGVSRRGSEIVPTIIPAGSEAEARGLAVADFEARFPGAAISVTFVQERPDIAPVHNIS